jgi:hypothetical protein
VDVCEDDALRMVTQTPESIEVLRKDWKFWLDLPTTPQKFSRIDDLDEKIGALETLLLDKKNYGSMACGDGACLGCGEKTAIHLFTGTVTALMQPWVKTFVEKIDGLVMGLEKHIRMKLTESVDFTDTRAVMEDVEANKGHDLTLAALSEQLAARNAGQPIDPKWLKWATQLLEKLKDLRWRYVAGPPDGAGRRWASSTPPAAPPCGVPPSPTTPIPSPGPPTCSRTRLPWPWACSRATWPRWRKASRPCAWPRSSWRKATTRKSRTPFSPISPGSSPGWRWSPGPIRCSVQLRMNVVKGEIVKGEGGRGKGVNPNHLPEAGPGIKSAGRYLPFSLLPSPFTLFRRKTFAHGVHPAGNKSTAGTPIRRMPFAPRMTLPISQHIGKPAVPTVRAGQEVVRGQLIARADGFMSMPLHAPADGVVEAIEPRPTAQGNWADSIVIRVYEGSVQELAWGEPRDMDAQTPEEIVQAVWDTGLVGL